MALITYIILFCVLYFQVFLLVTFFEHRHTIAFKQRTTPTLARFPSVTIMVPCYNEERTISGTIESLLALKYPKDKLTVLIIDDGSTDSTYAAAEKFVTRPPSPHARATPQIELYHKENGGKWTALNLGLTKTMSELVGCLDADSFVHPDALLHIVKKLENQDVMAVTPTIRVYKPANYLQRIQNTEYSMSIFLRKMFGILNALHVTPGPFSIFRTSVFSTLGPYRHAHNTEDMEIALRMHAHHYRIDNSESAFVFTATPHTIRGLFKQRLRWVYGFMKNALDYRFMFFRREYGNLGMLTLPFAMFSIGSALYFAAFSFISIARKIMTEIIQIETVGIHFRLPAALNWFYINTEVISLLACIFFSITLFLVLTGKRIAEGNSIPTRDTLYYFLFYSFLAPWWLARAVFDVLFARKNSWR